MKASVAITTLPANGANAAAPPSTSAATAASSTPSPAPPKRSGTSRPGRPSSTRLSHNAGSKPLPVSAWRRSASIDTRSASRPRSESGEQALLLAEGEFHQALATFGSRGRSRPRSEMMFFWMLFEPPPIISPTSYR